MSDIGLILTGFGLGALVMNFYWSRVFRRHSAQTRMELDERRAAIGELEVRHERRYQEMRRKLGIWESPS